MSILGTRVVRTEDPKFLTVGGTYVDDVRDPLLTGAAHVTYVRSTVAHAKITSIDVEEAKAAPGVIAVVTGAEVDMTPAGFELLERGAEMARPWLATDTVRFVGEPVAAVVTEQHYQGEDAAELVAVGYDELPVVVDPAKALEGDTLLFPGAGTNVAATFDDGIDEDMFDGCEVVVTETIDNQRVAPAPMEVRAAASAWGPDGRLTHWASTQAPQGTRDDVAKALGIDAAQVRVIAPDVGGGFGAKMGNYPEEVMVAWLARKLGRPLRWVETRSESMMALGHGRAQRQTVTIGGSRDGTVTAYRLDILQDAGAYPKIGAFLPYLTRMMAPGVYDIERVASRATSVATNTMSTGAYRGAGRPEAAAAIERAIDLFAVEIGMDPAEVRRRNFIAKDSFPFTTKGNATYDSGDYATALEKVLTAGSYDVLRAEQRRRREAGETVLLGLGLSTYVEITAGDSFQGEDSRVEIHPDGTATVFTGTSPHGQGHVTSWAMIASDELGIPMEKISVVHGDTDVVTKGVGTFGSRSLQLGGAAVQQASTEVVGKARELAGELLEVAASDLVLDKAVGAFHVAGDPSGGMSWGELASAAAQRDGGELAADVHFVPAAPTFPFGAHLAVVEVDTGTGKATLSRMITVDDAGRVLNPLIVEGQRHGGIAQGAAQALMEEMRYDDAGNPVTANFADYAFISATELPSFELVEMQTPTTMNALGAKGIGEAGTIGATPAVQNAVIDALAHLGVRHIDMPTTPERVWQAITAAKGQ